MDAYLILRNIYHFYEKKKQEAYMKGLVKNGLRLGKNVGILDECFLDPSHCYLISIGDNCTLCPRVRLIAHDASTKKILGYTTIGKIEIKENCFIGDSSIILPNVTIGKNSIVGAGSIVTRDVPPASIVVGNPARLIGSVNDYIKKITLINKDKKIFDENYFIENLDEQKRKEMIQSIGDSIGFII